MVVICFDYSAVSTNRGDTPGREQTCTWQPSIDPYILKKTSASLHLCFSSLRFDHLRSSSGAWGFGGALSALGGRLGLWSCGLNPLLESSIADLDV